jgi:UDP-N-acetylmuramoylalanine--D-glutamate ligase
LIAVETFSGRRVAVFGLGGSGLATVRALVAGGADVAAFDDNAASVERAAAEGLPVEDFRSADFAQFAALVLSPGVPLTHPKPHWAAALAQASGVEVIGDIELFCRERRASGVSAPFIAVTGTNGKSTTTALIAHILKEAGRDVQLGGNIGVPILSLEPPAPNRVYVVECSSYQIDLAPSLDPTVGVLLNLSEDHLDRHGSMEIYAAVKERLVAAAETAVIGVDDAMSAAVAERRLAAEKRTFRISTQTAPRGDAVWAVATRVVEPHGLAQMVVADLLKHPVLRGTHNAQNVAAAVAATRLLGVGLDELRAGIMSFPGLPHRMEPVGKLGRVTFVNDSKATNADAAARALSSYSRIYWIAGGKPKTGGITSLAGYFPRIAKAYLIGEAAEDFAATLDGHVPAVISGTLDTAVLEAASDAVEDPSGDVVVLLSPACASFDQFKNFELRGDAFRSLVQSLPDIEPARE